MASQSVQLSMHFHRTTAKLKEIFMDDYGRKDFRNARDAYADEAPRTIWKIFTRVIVPFMIVGVLISGITWTVRILSMPAGIIERVADPDNAIYNLEWFRTQYHQINATKAQIMVAQEQLDTFVQLNGLLINYNFNQRQEYSRLTTNVSGLKQFCLTTAADYNAHAEMITRRLYQGNDLPKEVSCQ
jgi:hypothetical protein